MEKFEEFFGAGNVDAAPLPEILFSLTLKDNFDPPQGAGGKRLHATLTTRKLAPGNEIVMQVPMRNGVTEKWDASANGPLASREVPVSRPARLVGYDSCHRPAVKLLRAAL